ncbi:MAG: phospholipase [Sphingobium sp.]|nr:phospholipase [Sphingobium sp.]
MPPNGFAQARYQMKLPDDVDATKAVFSFPIWSSQHMMMAKAAPAPSSGVQAAQYASQSENDALLESKTLLDGKTAVSASPTSSPALLISGGATNPALTGPSTAAPIPSDRTAGNEFFGNFAAYEPIYAVYGPGTNTDARIQISFKYRLFGSRQDQGLPSSWRDGLHLAYTQRMFWDLGAYSMPFRNIDYQPELFYLTPSATYRNGVSVAGQIGLRHESNGRDGPESRSINSIYVAPMASFPLTGIFKGDGYSFTIAPRLALTVGSLSDNPDIMRYRGNTSMVMEIGKDDGWRITTSSRFNFASGKGAASLDLSYPLAKLLGGGPDFYIFGQSFIGYGENLLDYNRHVTRFRIGVALIR